MLPSAPPAVPPASGALTPHDGPPGVASLEEELRRARQALRERDQQVDLIEELAGLGSWEIDLATDRVYWSREQRRLHGVDDAGVPATHAAFMALVHPDDRARMDAGMAALGDGEPRTVEYRIRRPDGGVRLLQARARLVPAEGGRAARVLGTSLDVTDRRDAARRLREYEEHVAHLERLSATGSWEYDLTAERITWSREQLRIHGLPLDQPQRPRPSSWRSSTPTTGRASWT
jgi:PAS domain S-box-containing protein